MPQDNPAGYKAPGEPSKADLLDEARKRYDRAYRVDQDNRDQGIDDLKFVAGEQWPEEVRQQYAEENKTVATINRMPQFLRRVTGQIRTNRPSIRARPADDQADTHTADVITGVIRHIESLSSAKIGYQISANNSVGGNIGWMRILNDYADPLSFEQDLFIEPVYDAHSVYCDPSAKHPTRMDANWMFVTEEVAEDEFKDQYPDAVMTDWERIREDAGDLWYNDETITVAEYWVKRSYTERIGRMTDGTIISLDKLSDDEIEFLRAGALPQIIAGEEVVNRLEEERKARGVRIVRYKMTGAEILEGPEEWPGRHIPLVAVSGEEIHIGKRTVRRSLIHAAKDAQRAYNYAVSTAIDVTALQPKAPYIATAKQIGPYEKMWREAGRRNVPYLLYDYDERAPGMPQRSQPPVASEGIIALIQQSSEDMKSTTGIYDASLGARSNETAGVAIAERQEEADVGTSVFPDHLVFAVEQLGRILVELIPVFYGRRKVVRILNEDDTEKQVVINELFVDEKTGQEREIRFDTGKYDVIVDAGPSYATRRQEAVESMATFVQANPQIASLVMDLIAKYSDWPGAEEFRERFRKMLPPGIAEPEDGEEPQMTPQEMLQMIAQHVEQLVQQSELRKKEAEADEAEAQAEGQRLENVKTAIEAAMQGEEFRMLLDETVQQAMLGFQGGGQDNRPPGN